MARTPKFIYYIRANLLLLTPKAILRYRMRKALRAAENSPEKEYLMNRVNYYNKLEEGSPLPDDAPALKDHTLKNKKTGSVYFYDSYEITRHFPDHLKWLLKGGDVTTVPPYPTVVKSRPIAGDNASSMTLATY